MNILKWITSRAGVASSTVLKAVGLTTVVGAAGIAALQFLDSPADNTAFNPAAQYDPGEVVYVAGGGAGSYGSGGFSVDGYSTGEASSSMRISSAQINRLDRLTQADSEEEVAEEAVAPSDPLAYQMGGSEGLGMNANVANEAELKNNPMAMMGDMMSNISNITQGVQGAAAGATGAGAAAAQEGAAAGAPALAAAQKDWSKGAATSGSAGGNAFNSSFVVQDSAKSGSNAGNVSAEQAADVMKQFQGQMSSIRENAQMRAKSNFGKAEGLPGSWDASVAKSRTSKEANELAFIRKRSVDTAKNSHRAANEASRAFLASTKISGGMRISSENFVTGTGQSSADFNNDYEANLRGIKNWAEARDEYEEERQKELNSLKGWFWGGLAVAIAAMIAIPIIKNIPLWGMIAAICIAVAAIIVLVVGFALAIKFGEKYGYKGWPLGISIALPILMAGVACSFFLADAFLKFFTKVGSFLGFGNAAIGGGIVIGGITAGVVGGGVSSGGNSNTEDLGAVENANADVNSDKK